MFCVSKYYLEPFLEYSDFEESFVNQVISMSFDPHHDSISDQLEKLLYCSALAVHQIIDKISRLPCLTE